MEIFRVDDNHDPTDVYNPPPDRPRRPDPATQNLRQLKHTASSPTATVSLEDIQSRIDILLGCLLRLFRYHTGNSIAYPAAAYRSFINTLRCIIHGVSLRDGPCNLHIGEESREHRIRWRNQELERMIEEFGDHETREIVESLIMVVECLKEEDAGIGRSLEEGRMSELMKKVKDVVGQEMQKVFRQDHGIRMEKEPDPENRREQEGELEMNEDVDAEGEVVEMNGNVAETMWDEQDNSRFRESDDQNRDNRHQSSDERPAVTEISSFGSGFDMDISARQRNIDADTNPQSSAEGIPSPPHQLKGHEHPSYPAQPLLADDSFCNSHDSDGELTIFPHGYNITNEMRQPFSTSSPYQTRPSTPPPEASDRANQDDRATSHSPLSNLAMSPSSSQPFLLHNRASTPPHDPCSSPPPQKYRRLSLVDRKPTYVETPEPVSQFSAINAPQRNAAVGYKSSPTEEQEQERLSQRGEAVQAYRYQQFQQQQQQQQRSVAASNTEGLGGFGYSASPPTSMSRYPRYSAGTINTPGSSFGDDAGGRREYSEQVAYSGENAKGSGGKSGMAEREKDLNWLKSLRVTELKEELRARGCRVSGLKADLIVRLGKNMGLIQ